MGIVTGALLGVLGVTSAQTAEETAAGRVSDLIAEAEAFLHESTLYLTLERLREAARLAPDDYRIHKVRGDVLMSFRRNPEALAAYRQAAAVAPEALEVHWAIWALLDRLGVQHQAILSLQDLARLDPANPLVHLRLAGALSQVNRLEEAAASYQRAVALAPDQHAFRLLYARALFDILDYAGARREINAVLAGAEPGSRAWGTARDLLAYVRGETHDKGRRFDDSQTLRKKVWYTDQNLKDWVLTRGRAWQLMEQGRYDQAEAALRKALTFNPEDHRAWYDLGLTLMELGKWEEAIIAFEEGVRLTKYGEFYPNSVFQIGRCLARLGRWKEAMARYERVLEIRDWQREDFYWLNFPDLGKVQAALEEARQHLPVVTSEPAVLPPANLERFGPEPYEYPIPPLANGRRITDPIEVPAQFVAMGAETVKGAFRQAITAREVVQDDLQTGWHDFMPIDPTDTFTPRDAAIHVVFTLTNNQEAETPLISRWVAERVAGLAPETLLGTDKVLVGLNERTGYFRLRRPAGGWPSGTYRVDLYLGDQASAYTHMAEVRFRIVADSGIQSPRP